MRNIKYVLFLLLASTLIFACKSDPEPVKEEKAEVVKEVEKAVEEIEEEKDEEAVEEYDGQVDGVYTVSFAPGAYKVDYLTKGTLNLIIEQIKAEGAKRILIIGHSAKLNSEKEEEIISRKRANAVGQYLDDSGLLDGLDATVKYVGAEEPVSAHNEITGRSNNRRVEIKIEK